MIKLKRIIYSNKPLILIIAVNILVLIIGTLTIGFKETVGVLALSLVSLFGIRRFYPKKRKIKHEGGPIMAEKKKNNVLKLLKKNINKKLSSTTKKGKTTTPKKTGSKSKSNKVKITSAKKEKIIKIIIIGGLAFLILSLLALFWLIFTVIQRAPEFNPDNLYKKEASVLYDKDNKVIAKIGSEIREKITYDEMPQVLVDAIVATEDSRFFTHNGFDLPRFLKASLGQATGNRSAGGASTLTMQVSKNNFTSTEAEGIDGIIRKFTDIYMAIFKIEKQYTKYEILEFYANSNYLGGGAHGVEQASLAYFGKSAKDMNLAEAATIAGLFNAPFALDPTRNPEGCNKRKNVVLYLMHRHGYITEEQRKIASDIHVEDLLVEKTERAGGFQSFINTVTDEVEKRTGKNPYTVPMEIYTTMDRAKQTHLDGIFNGETYTWENEFVNAGMAVIDVKTGAIVAVGAGRNHKGLRVFNYATMTKRQIGSTAKPLYDYAPGMEFNNWSTYTPFSDEPHSYSSGVSIKNWDRKFQGFMTLREALKVSRNIPSLKAFQSLKNSDVNKFVTSLGLSPEKDGNLIHEAHALGGYNGESPLSMAAAYSAFANGGYYTEPYSFTKVIYKDTNETFENKPTKNKVMSEETAYMITDILVDSSKYSFGSTYNINGTPYASKTGTSNFSNETIKKFKLNSNPINDLWISSYSANYAVAQWYGYEKINSEYYTKHGNSHFKKLYQAAVKGIFTDGKNFEKPSNVIPVTIEKGSYPAMLPSEFTPSEMLITELFVSGTEPTDISPRYSKLKAPSNLEMKESGSSINLTWDSVPTPDFVNLDFLTKRYKTIFSDASSANRNLNDHLSYNQNYIGEFGYQVSIYENGILKESSFTKNNSFTYNLKGESNLTFKVKSSYSIFKNNASSEVEKKYTSSNTSPISSSLNGNSMVLLNSGATYTEPAKPVTVYNQGTDVTPLATITKRIEDINGNVLTNLNTSNPGTYYIIYYVTHQGYTRTHIRTIVIS